MKTDQIYIVPKDGRYFIIRSDKKVVGNKEGYKSKDSANSAKRFLLNAGTALKHQYVERARLEKHWRSI